MNAHDETPASLVEIEITKIDIPEDRLRLVNEAQVGQLLNSFLEVGQLTPIEVGPPDEDGRYRLIIGAHRVTAARAAEFQTIKAIVFSGNADEARLHEIDENLYRHELNALDQASFLAERRAVFERVHGPIVAGRPAKKGNRAKLAQFSFFDETTQKFGLPKRTIQRALERRSAINDREWMLLRALRISIKGADLDSLKGQPEEVQRKIVAKLIDPEGKFKTLAAAFRSEVGKRTAGKTPAPSLWEQFVIIWEDMNSEQKDRVRAHVARKQKNGN